ncbi:MAG: hypothetical protein ACK45U_07685 [bacterium]
MSLQFSAFNHNEWKNLVEENQIDSLFYQPVFHSIVIKRYNCDCSYYQIKDNSETILALPVFHRNRDASFITHFFYQAVYFNEKLSERKKIEAFNLLASSLTKHFDKIDFKLDPIINDVRAFTWNAFESKVYYSYHLNLSLELNYSENINRQLKKYDKIYKVERLSKLNDHLIDAHIRDMVKNKLGKAEAVQVKQWLKDFHDLNLLDVFEMTDENGQEQGSAIYIRDKNSSYLVAVMSNNSSQALLYDKVIEYYRSENIKEIDLLGANIQNVAIYKSQFDAKLISYHIVSYRKNKEWESIKNTIKRKIKSIYK